MFSWNYLFIGRLTESICIIPISSKLLNFLMFIQGLTWFVSSSSLDHLLSYWGIVIGTFGLNMSLNKWLFYRVSETSSCLCTNSLLNFILRSTDYIVYSEPYRFNFLLSVKVSPHLVICLNEFFKFFL